MGRYDDRIIIGGKFRYGVKIGEGGGCMTLPFPLAEVDKVVLLIKGPPRYSHPQMLMGGCNADGSEYICASHSTSEFYNSGYVKSINVSNTSDQTFDNSINEITLSDLSIDTSRFLANYWGFGYYGTTFLNTYWYKYTLYEARFYKNNALYAAYDFDNINGATVPDVSGNGRNANLYTVIGEYGPVNKVIAGFPVVPFKIRYIEIGSNGNSVNGGNFIVECFAFDLNHTNVALNKPVTSNFSTVNYPLSRITDGNTDTALYADVGTITTIDLQAEHDIDQIQLFRYYGDGRTFYQTYIKVYNGDKSKSAYVHNYTTQGVYAEEASGRSFPGNHLTLGENGWGRDWRYLDLYVGAVDSSAKRITRYVQHTTNYGDKVAYNNSGGFLYLNDQRWFNLNQNYFNFRAYVAKDYAGDRQIASFKNVNNTAGWSLMWLADGRVRWETRYNNTSYYSYTSNYLPATNTYYEIVVNFPRTGTGAGDMYWGGVWTSANRSGRHQMSSNYLVCGTWGIFFRGYIRCYGIDGSGNYHDIYGYINNLAVSSNNQTAGSLGTVNTTVSQDTSVTESWV